MKYIVANWKMNFTNVQKINHFFKDLKTEFKKINENKQGKLQQVKIIIAPSFIWLDCLKKLFQEIKNELDYLNFELSAQDCFWENQGNFTGEISSLAIKNIGCQYVILGHSERKFYLKETDLMVNQKIIKAVENNLWPILCISVEERDLSKSEEKIYLQLKNYFQDIKEDSLEKTIFVYEPMWAISGFKGNSCSLNEVERGISVIIQSIKKIYPNIDVNKLNFLYGGSVGKQNARGFLKVTNGLLIGKSSLDPKEFFKIIQATL